MRKATLRRGLPATVFAGFVGSLASLGLFSCLLTIAPLDQAKPDATMPTDAARDATIDRGEADGRIGDAAPPDSSASGCGEASLATDPANCGACNHDCLEGGCLLGKCLPVALYSVLGSEAAGIYVSNDVVFITLYLPSPAGAVLEVHPSNDVLQSDLARPTMIVGNGTTTLFWTVGGTSSPDNNEAGIGSLANGAAHFLGLSGPAIHPRAIVILDGGDVAFANVIDGGSVMRVAGSLSGIPKIVTTTAGNYFGLATDGTHLWTTSVSDNVLYRLDPADGGHTTQHVVYANPEAGPQYVAYRDGKVFVSLYKGSYVGVIDQPLLDQQPLRALVTAETPFASTPLVADAGLALTAVFAIAADDRYVYWTDKGSDKVGRVAYADGGPAEVVAYISQSGPNQIYVTDAAVYFTAVIDGTVYRVAK